MRYKLSNVFKTNNVWEKVKIKGGDELVRSIATRLSDIFPVNERINEHRHWWVTGQRMTRGPEGPLGKGEGKGRKVGEGREKEEEDLGYPSIHKPGRDSRAGIRERRTEPTGWHIVQTHPIGVLSS